MFKVKKVTPDGQCCAMRCTSAALDADNLCERHLEDWQSEGKPALLALSSSKGQAPKEDTLHVGPESIPLPDVSDVADQISTLEGFEITEQDEYNAVAE